MRLIDFLSYLPIAASSAPMSVPPLIVKQMPPSVQTVSFVDGDQFLVNKPHDWTVGSTNKAVTVPAGFVTDYASIPSGLRGVFERQGRYSRAALVHDFLYWSQTCTRLQSDNLFMIAMIETGVSATQRRAIYRAVRLGGGSAWSENRRDKLAGMVRVVPVRYYGFVDGMTWKGARAELTKLGVRDATFVRDPELCALGASTKVP